MFQAPAWLREEASSERQKDEEEIQGQWQLRYGER